MKDWMLVHVCTTLLPAVLGPATYVVSRYVLNLWEAIDALPATPKRAVVFTIALALTTTAHALGISLPNECSELSGGGLTAGCQAALAAPVFLKSAVGALGAYLLHALKKSDPRDGVRALIGTGR
jgi:hypothetical protein